MGVRWKREHCVADGMGMIAAGADRERAGRERRAEEPAWSGSAASGLVGLAMWGAASLSDELTRWRRDTVPELPAKIREALPVAGFFIVLFWIVVVLFGISQDRKSVV